MTLVNSVSLVKEKEKADGLEVEYLGKGFDGTNLSNLNPTRNISIAFALERVVLNRYFKNRNSSKRKQSRLIQRVNRS
jgi:hypothetical protein